MRFLSVLFPLALSAALPLAAQKPLTVEAIYAHGSLTGRAPSELTWSPDAKHLTYLEDGTLMEIDLATGKPRVLVNREKIDALTGGKDSEKDRDHRERYKMASYLWSPDSRHLLFDAEGALWLYDIEKGSAARIGSTGEASGGDPKFSPDGKALSFIRNHGLAVLHFGEPGAQTLSLAPAPNADTLNGEVDWVYAEELDVRSNAFWAPDSHALAFLSTDESAVPAYPITDWIPTHATVDNQRYPQPGDPNPNVRVGVVGARGGATVWANLPIKAGEDYIPRFGWADAKTLWIETLSRDHKHLGIYLADAATGQAHPALQLTDDKFFNESYDVSVGNGQMVLAHWGDGHTHLYLYRFDAASKAPATLQRQLTSGNFEVSEIARVDFDAQIVDYASNEGNPLGQQLWEVNFAGQRKLLTNGQGFHTAKFAPTGKLFTDRFSSRLAPATLRLCQAESCKNIWESKSLAPYRVHAPELIEAKAADGSTLYATLLLPEGVTSPASVPLIVNPYGGPGPQSVVDRWSDGILFDQLLTEHGFAVLHADNRGTDGRGRDFSQAAYHNFGPVQLADQLTVVDAVLKRYPQLDDKRLGWWGWSWGGTFTLYSLSHSDRFRAGVAVAPVTDWRNYDSIYTERYMSQPKDFPQGYKDFSVVNSASQLKGRLLLVHGTGDDNVHMENSVQYIQKLIEAQLPYDLQIYPRKTHSIAGRDVRIHLFNRILAHFETYLKPAVH